MIPIAKIREHLQEQGLIAYQRPIIALALAVPQLAMAQGDPNLAHVLARCSYAIFALVGILPEGHEKAEMLNGLAGKFSVAAAVKSGAQTEEDARKFLTSEAEMFKKELRAKLAQGREVAEQFVQLENESCQRFSAQEADKRGIK